MLHYTAAPVVRGEAGGEREKHREGGGVIRTSTAVHSQHYSVRYMIVASFPGSTPQLIIAKFLNTLLSQSVYAL